MHIVEEMGELGNSKEVSFGNCPGSIIALLTQE